MKNTSLVRAFSLLPIVILFFSLTPLSFANSTVATYIEPTATPFDEVVDSEGVQSDSSEQLAVEALAQNVKLVSQLGGCACAIAVKGDYAYVGIGPRLYIIDISSPQHPIFVGRTSVLAGVVTGVAFAGTGAYSYQYASVAAVDKGLRIINVSNPKVPNEIGFYDTPGWAYDLVLTGSTAFIADFHRGLRVINVANPNAPIEVGFYDTPGFALGVDLIGDYAYVADSPSSAIGGGLRIINVSNRTHPVQVSFYDTPGNANSVVREGNNVFVADGSSGLRVLDVYL